MPEKDPFRKAIEDLAIEVEAHDGEPGEYAARAEEISHRLRWGLKAHPEPEAPATESPEFSEWST